MEIFKEYSHKAEEIGERLAEAEEKYLLLDKLEKHILAKIATEKEGSEAKRDRLARSDERYLNHIRALAKAKGDLIQARVDLERLNKLHDQGRTEASLERAKMNLI